MPPWTYTLEKHNFQALLCLKMDYIQQHQNLLLLVGVS